MNILMVSEAAPKKNLALLFSATMPPRIERLAADFLDQAVRITAPGMGTWLGRW